MSKAICVNHVSKTFKVYKDNRAKINLGII